MYSVALFIAVAAVAYLLFQQCRTFRYIRELEEAIQRRKPYLHSRTAGGGLGGRRLLRFGKALNDLLTEEEHSRRQGETYLQQIEATLGSLTDSVLIVNAHYRLVMANTAACKLLSLPKNCEGRHLEQILPSAKFLEYLQQNQSGKTPPWREIEIYRSNGQQLFLEVSTTRIAQTEKDSPLILIVLHDITRLKKLENLRREFVANVSHELRTPVTIIKGYSDALASDHDRLSTEEQLRFLGKIQKNVQRLHLLLEDLLTLSRLEGGEAQPNLTPTSLHKLIAEQVELFQSRLEGERQVICQLDPQIDAIKIDPIKIAQVVRNILDNTLRYAKGFDRIRITTSLEPTAVLLSIEDNGCGIPEKDLPHIFERFYTVDKSRSRDFGGTGLGLSIVKHIVQLHNGQISATNLKPRGLRIECRLPLL